MFLILYKYLTYIFSIPIIIFFLIRYLKKKENSISLKEKFGVYSKERPKGNLIWVNASSIGESLSILPIIKKLNSLYPNCHILFTSSTITSSKIIALRKVRNLTHQFTPIDLNFIVEKFYKHWRPNIGIFVESELWPNLIFQMKNYNVTSVLVNARISERTFKRWKIIRSFAQQILNNFELCLVQDENILKKFSDLNVKKIKNVGNLKFLSEKLPINNEKYLNLKKLISRKQVILLASSHKNEEEIILSIIQKLKSNFKNIILIIVPRHIKRSKEIQYLMRKKGIKYKVRSNNEKINGETICYLADTIGELSLFYELSTITIIGGSFVNHGGQNPIECSYFNCSLILGPHMENFVKISQILVKNGAALQIKDIKNLESTIVRFLKNKKLRVSYSEKLKKICQNEKLKAQSIWVELKKVFRKYVK